jgi:hypothetical protein
MLERARALRFWEAACRLGLKGVSVGDIRGSACLIYVTIHRQNVGDIRQAFVSY